MKHFIITRFDYKPDYPHLADRLQKFFQFTLPSIKAQTCKDFEWLILTDYPPVAVMGVTYLPPGRYNKQGTYLRGEYIEYMKKASKGEDYLVMTRLDNDDILMPTYIEDMQQAVREGGIGLYEFKGYRLDLRMAKFYEETNHHKKLTSPFLTLAQNPNKFRSVYCDNHSKMWKHFRLTIMPKRNWVQIIHDTNWVLNKGDGAYYDERGIECNIPPFVVSLLESGPHGRNL
jgi:hypothetical protein